jgi:hypothetical protein
MPVPIIVERLSHTGVQTAVTTPVDEKQPRTVGWPGRASTRLPEADRRSLMN